MVKIDTRVTESLEEQIKKYAALKKINKSEAIRQLIEAGLDVTAHESELLKELKSLRGELKDHHSFNKKAFDRLASLNVKNGKKVFALFHLVLIQIFLRGKDKGMSDDESLQSRDQSMQTATKMGMEEFNSKG